jgi:hypothetical protein
LWASTKEAMAEGMNDNSNEMKGRLFPNKDKDAGHPKRPDSHGSCVIDGRVYWISAWNNRARNSGEQYQALIFKLKEQVAASLPASSDEPPLKEPEAVADDQFEMPF